MLYNYLLAHVYVLKSSRITLPHGTLLCIIEVLLELILTFPTAIPDNRVLCIMFKYQREKHDCSEKVL